MLNLQNRGFISICNKNRATFERIWSPPKGQSGLRTIITK